MSDSVVLDRLSEAVGDAHVLRDHEAMAPFCEDWRGRYRGRALCVVRPGTTAEVSRVVELCAYFGKAIVPQGGNTGLCGGATPIGGEVLLSLTRLNRVRAVDVANEALIAEAGCTLAAVQQAAAEVDRLFPLSLAAEGSATIGGNLATNAGGVQVLRYGTARDLALGLEVVFPDGRIWDGLRVLRKNNTGYDLKHWFIGAEGTLGIITAASLKLFAQPRHLVTAWVTVDSLSGAIELFKRLRDGLGDTLTAFELISAACLELVLRHIPQTRAPLSGPAAPWNLLIEAGAAVSIEAALQRTLGQALEAGLILDAACAASLDQARHFWRLRESIAEAQKAEGLSIKHDISVPIARIPEFVDATDAAVYESFPEARIACFGHLGDGNLHYNVALPGQSGRGIERSDQINHLVYERVAACDGSISAEHGLGQLKRETIRRYKSELELEAMRGLKQMLDPHGRMNPGKVL